MVCTNVAARGLDFQNVGYVVQYDPPEDAKEFVHQCGRAGRLGTVGETLLFVLPSEEPFIKVLATHDLHLASIAMGELLEGLSENGASAERAASQLQYSLEKAVEGDEEAG